jgi:hypothetical protein
MNFHAIPLEQPQRASGLDSERRPQRGQKLIGVGWLVLAVAISAVVVAGLMAQNRLAIAWTDVSCFVLLGLFTGLGAARYWARHTATLAQRRLRDFSEYAMLMIAMSAIGGLASYAVSCDTHGYADAFLARIDAALRFNWLAWYATVAQHRLLQQLGAAAYGSIYISPVALLATLAWRGEAAHAQRFLACFWLSATITLSLFPLFPAKGALEYLWHGPIPYMPTNGLYQGQIIPALRAHQFGPINLGALRGLVCAPSFHTVCATLYIGFSAPVKGLRWFLVPLNLAMFLSIPVEGTHYLSDMLLGLVVALLAMGVVHGATARFGRRPPAQSIWA